MSVTQIPQVTVRFTRADRERLQREAAREQLESGRRVTVSDIVRAATLTFLDERDARRRPGLGPQMLAQEAA